MVMKSYAYVVSSLWQRSRFWSSSESSGYGAMAASAARPSLPGSITVSCRVKRCGRALDEPIFSSVTPPESEPPGIGSSE